MTTFTLGQQVRISGTAKKRRGHERYDGGDFRTYYEDGPIPHVWNREDGTTYDTGVIVGRRTVQDGKTVCGWAASATFMQTPGTARRVWLVAYDLRYRPVMCFDHQVEAI